MTILQYVVGPRWTHVNGDKFQALEMFGAVYIAGSFADVRRRVLPSVRSSRVEFELPTRLLRKLLEDRVRVSADAIVLHFRRYLSVHTLEVYAARIFGIAARGLQYAH